jgi:putative (di)nucleoside polyphosphate hydrolase
MKRKSKRKSPTDLPWRQNVGVMLMNSEGRVFVGQRRDRDQEAWQMPQGGIDRGEDAVTAALRELQEETGVPPDLVELVAVSDRPLTYDLPPEIQPTIWGGRYRGQAQTWVLLRFLGADSDVDIATEHPEFSAWEWCRPDDLVARIVAFKRDVYGQVLQEFGPIIAAQALQGGSAPRP